MNRCRDKRGAYLAQANVRAETGAPVQTQSLGHDGTGAHDGGTKRARQLSASRKRQLAGWLFLTPAILYLLFAFLLPIIYNVMLSFEQTSVATIGDLTAPYAGSGKLPLHIQ